MNFEMILRTLFKVLKIGDDKLEIFRQLFDAAPGMIVDAKREISNMDARLARIEAKLGIPADNQPSDIKAIENGNRTSE